uniref:Uncharacterized protein n=1 Tax=Trypanosoma congolense (strain IL3000) TaxID=1068625 RepID=G0UNG7_TRYCI|nr:hypothetical protein, unlikely [Trypanosoma congolense IL3000]
MPLPPVFFVPVTGREMGRKKGVKRDTTIYFFSRMCVPNFPFFFFLLIFHKLFKVNFPLRCFMSSCEGAHSLGIFFLFISNGTLLHRCFAFLNFQCRAAALSLVQPAY